MKSKLKDTYSDHAPLSDQVLQGGFPCCGQLSVRTASLVITYIVSV